MEDIQILDTILNTITTACVGNGTIVGYAKSLFGILITLDFVVSVLFNLLSFGSGQNFISQTITKIICYGFWLYIIESWGTICNATLDSLTIAGSSLGGFDSEILKHPSDIITKGFKDSEPIWDWLTNQAGMLDLAKAPGAYVFAFFAALAIIIAYSIIAIQVFITYIEFYISSTLMLLFIPFATNKYTERFAQNCIGGVFSHGVKLMFLGAIISLTAPVMNTIQVNIQGTPAWDNLAAYAIAPMTLAFLCWQAPGMAAGFMSGGPALSGAMAVGAASFTGGMIGGAIGGAVSKAAGAAGAGNMGIAKAAQATSGPGGGGPSGGDGGSGGGGSDDGIPLSNSQKAWAATKGVGKFAFKPVVDAYRRGAKTVDKRDNYE